jgi:hypothetical protein
MQDVRTHRLPAPARVGDETLPAPISLRELWPWALFAVALMALIYFVGVDEGASSVVPGDYVHEFMHDGRHLLGFPCD